MQLRNHRRKNTSHGFPRNRRTAFLHSSGLAILLTLAVTGCALQPAFRGSAAPTAIASCFPDSVFTAEEMRLRIDCHPDDYKLKIDRDTFVLFAFLDPILDWAGPIFFIHVPSVSEVVVDSEGSVFFENFKSVPGRNAIENVLNNRPLMDRILERAREIKESNPP
jgi:hypothetical protein